MTIVSVSWGVIIAQHQRNKLVSEALVNLGIEHFIPLIESLSIVRGRHVREQRPLLGEYIPIAINKDWKSLLRVRGVTGILLNELGFPAQVLPREMDRLHAMCDGGLYRSTNVEAGGFEYGQRVSPRDGPLSSQTGRYDGKVNRRGDNAALFLLFGVEKRIVFKAGDLLAV